MPVMLITLIQYNDTKENSAGHLNNIASIKLLFAMLLLLARDVKACNHHSDQLISWLLRCSSGHSTAIRPWIKIQRINH